MSVTGVCPVSVTGVHMGAVVDTPIVSIILTVALIVVYFRECDDADGCEATHTAADTFLHDGGMHITVNALCTLLWGTACEKLLCSAGEWHPPVDIFAIAGHIAWLLLVVLSIGLQLVFEQWVGFSGVGFSGVYYRAKLSLDLTPLPRPANSPTHHPDSRSRPPRAREHLVHVIRVIHVNKTTPAFK